MTVSRVRRVLSDQSEADERLAGLLERRRGRQYSAPVAEHARRAFEAMLKQGNGHDWVLDAGCGKGESTGFLAARHEDCCVIGVDRSRKRLTMPEGELLRRVGDNAWLLRTDLISLWQLLAESGQAVRAQYLFYPNPYPKPAHLARRWPAHPVFPLLLAIGGYIEVRSNWQPYIAEWAMASRLLGGPDRPVEAWLPVQPWTAFERKYHGDGQGLYRWRSAFCSFID